MTKRTQYDRTQPTATRLHRKGSDTTKYRNHTPIAGLSKSGARLQSLWRASENYFEQKNNVYKRKFELKSKERIFLSFLFIFNQAIN